MRWIQQRNLRALPAWDIFQYHRGSLLQSVSIPNLCRVWWGYELHQLRCGSTRVLCTGSVWGEQRWLHTPLLGWHLCIHRRSLHVPNLCGGQLLVCHWGHGVFAMAGLCVRGLQFRVQRYIRWDVCAVSE